MTNTQQDAQAVFTTKWPTVAAVLGYWCDRMRLRGHDAEDFASCARLALWRACLAGRQADEISVQVVLRAGYHRWKSQARRDRRRLAGRQVQSIEGGAGILAARLPAASVSIRGYTLTDAKLDGLTARATRGRPS